MSEHAQELTNELRARARLTFVRDTLSFTVVAGSLLLANRLTGRFRWARRVALVWAAALALQFVVRVVVPAVWSPVLEERFFQRELLSRGGS